MTKPTILIDPAFFFPWFPATVPSDLRKRIADDSQRLAYQSLEPKQALASISLDSGNGVLEIVGDNSNDVVTIIHVGNTVQVSASGIQQSYNRDQINSYDVRLVGGNDRFENNSDIAGLALGGTGDDVLIGGSTNDELNGGDGNDQLTGNGGDDHLLGGMGVDLIWGNDGNDILVGFHGDDQMDSGNGDDLLYGQAGNDVLRGGNGFDRLRGNWGNDELYGDGGRDILMGDVDADRLFGGTLNDVLYGGDGNDQLDGEDGNDTLYGMNDDDLLLGGNGDDVGRGGTGHDDLNGGTGDDRMLGDQGDDHLRGDSGIDRLRGGDGNDSLFGGGSLDQDWLYGEVGFDRFLTEDLDSPGDLDVDDAQLRFKNVTSQWTGQEIDVLDQAFQKLFDATGNNGLLHDSLDENPLTFFKYADLNGAAGLNQLQTSGSWELVNGQYQWVYTYAREIHILDWDESSNWYNNEFINVTLHEVGHNWDSELEMSQVTALGSSIWNGFLSESGWRNTNPNDPTHYAVSYSGNWWYLKTANFAEDYGRTNPYEDWATCWSLYFDESASSEQTSAIQEKLNRIDDLLSTLQS